MPNLPKHFSTALGVSSAMALLLAIGNASAETREYELSGFTGIKAATGVEVEVEVGPDFSIRADGPEDEIDRLEIDVKGDILSVRRKKKKGWGWNYGSGKFTVMVTMPSIRSVDVSSGSSVDVIGVSGGEITLDASSGASIDIAGTCDRVVADASSGARIDADEMVCTDGTGDVSSGASINMHVTDRFTGDASSGGSIDVAGNPPKSSTSTSSGGSIDVD